MNGIKRVIIVDKLNVAHQKRPLTRSKSSQGPPPKNLINENTRTNVSSAPPVKLTVPAKLNMTLRSSNRLYFLRQ